VALVAVAIVAISYLVAVNLLLRTRLLRNAISGSPLNFAMDGTSAALHLEYASAYSIVPGRVHIDGLTIRGRERTVEWFLSLDHADVAVSLVDLLRRSFHATRLRSSGFAIRARLRLDPVGATPEVLAALPPIAGLTDPPILDIGPSPPPLTDANYKLWMVDLEDVDVEHVREVWIHTIRSEGDTRVRGRWIFRPGRWLDVGPAVVDAEGVDVSYGEHRLATGLRGSITATVHPFDLREAKGLAIFDHVSSIGQLGGRAIIAGALQLLAPRSGVEFRRWEGPLDAHVILDHGKLGDGTHVRIDAPDCDIQAVGLGFVAPIRTEFSVGRDLATIDNRISGLRVSRLGAEEARVASITAAVTSSHLELAGAFDDARFNLDVGGAESNDVGRFLPPDPTWVVRSGVIAASGHAEGSLAQRGGRARLQLAVRRFTVERGKDQFTADVTGHAQLDDFSLPGAWAAGAATIAADDVAVRIGDAVVAGKLDARVDLRRWSWADRTFEFSGGDGDISTVSVKSARDGAALLVVPSVTAIAKRFVVAPSGVDGHVSIDLPQAELVDLGALRDLLPLPASLRVTEGTGRAKLHAEVELGSGAMQGAGAIAARGVRAIAGSTELFGNLDCAIIARRTGDSGGSTEFSGSTVAITNGGTGIAPTTQGAWWGNLALREATLRTNGGVRFDAKAHVSAKDATPATVLVSQNLGVPSWATDIFRMPVLGADAEIRMAPALLEVRSLVAHGGSTSLRAEYAKRDAHQDGAVLMDLGWIALGYDLADGATGLVLVGPESWFARKTDGIRNAAAAAERKTDAEEQLARFAAMTPRARNSEASVLAAQCESEVRACDATAIENLLGTAADAGERDRLSGIVYAPMVAAGARWGRDGAALDPLLIGSLSETLRIGGESTLDNIPSVDRIVAARDSNLARGKLVTVSGRAASVRREGSLSVGMLTTDAESVYFITPFATNLVPATLAHFHGVFVQRYDGRPPSLVLVGAFVP